MTFNFENTKKNILEKKDKSNIGSVDRYIFELCGRINNSEDYFTTSSCSGRIVIVENREKKSRDVFAFRSHDAVSFDEVKKKLIEITEKNSKGIFYFKQEPAFVVVSCKDKKSQWELFNETRNNGWKKSGILSIDKKLLVEIMSIEKIEFPIIKDGKILVSDELLKIVIENSNDNLEKGWKKINELERFFWK